MNKPIIYQLIPRLFSNYNETRKRCGTIEENGCGKLVDINERALKSIVDLGATHVWYTGVIRHATAHHNNPAITKGQAGSPYAITDYYDVDPDLAKDEKKRMAELEDLIKRTHEAGLGVILDFVPNHVSREYKSLCKPKGKRLRRGRSSRVGILSAEQFLLHTRRALCDGQGSAWL